MFDEISGYWKAYGGLSALVRSPYLWIALILTWLSSGWWSVDAKWPDTALAILPPLLGFTIGAMAVVLAFPTSKIFKYLAEDGRADSYYAQLAAKLVHFVILQAIGTILALFNKVISNVALAFVGSSFLFYSTLTAIAIGFALFGMAQPYNEAAGVDGK